MSQGTTLVPIAYEYISLGTDVDDAIQLLRYGFIYGFESRRLTRWKEIEPSVGFLKVPADSGGVTINKNKILISTNKSLISRVLATKTKSNELILTTITLSPETKDTFDEILNCGGLEFLKCLDCAYAKGDIQVSDFREIDNKECPSELVETSQKIKASLEAHWSSQMSEQEPVQEMEEVD